MAPGVAEGQGTPIAEAGVPQERQVDTFKLGQAEVLSPPGFDVLDPEKNVTAVLAPV